MRVKGWGLVNFFAGLLCLFLPGLAKGTVTDFSAGLRDSAFFVPDGSCLEAEAAPDTGGMDSASAPVPVDSLLLLADTLPSGRGKPKKEWSDVLFNVKVGGNRKSQKPKKPKKDGFLSHTFAGHVDRTFERKLDYSIVLVPSFSREGSVGIGGMGAALYRLDRTDSTMPPSDVSLSGNVSIKGFFYVGIVGNTYFKGGKSRLSYELSFNQRNLSFWGINYDSCAARPAIDYTRWKAKVNAYYDYELLPGFYAGAAVDFSYNAAVEIDDVSYLDGQERSYILTGLGLSLQYDTRDFVKNPTRGVNILLRQMVYPEPFGNCGRTLWRTTFTANYYQRLWKGAVLGFDLYAELNSRNSPWALREEAGGMYRLRGYYTGRYVDNNLLSAQIELRQKLFWRVGVAAFVGFGSVFPSFKELRPDHILPTYGVGLRFEFKHNVNLRVDYGFGRGTSGFVLSLGESF